MTSHIDRMMTTPCKSSPIFGSQLLLVSAPSLSPSLCQQLHSRVLYPMLRCLATCSRSTLKTRPFTTNGPTTSARIYTTRFHKQLPRHSNLLPRSTLGDRLALYSTKSPTTSSSSNVAKNTATTKLNGSNIEAVASQSKQQAAANDTKDIKRLFQLAKPEIKSITGKMS